MEFEKVLLSRKSCRSYKADKVEKEKLEKELPSHIGNELRFYIHQQIRNAP